MKYKLFQYCPVQQQVVPIEEVQRRAQSNAKDLFIQDEMEPIRNPLNPRQIFTSKSKLRAEYKAHGAIEVGDAYERGYSPEKQSEYATDRLVKNLKRQVIERYRNGR